MAARKSTTKKASPSKKAPAKKAPAKKASVKKVAAKKAVSKKPAAKKPTATKAPATKAAKKTAKATEPKSPESKQPKAAAKGVSSTQVNMGVVFSLRPRVSKTFRQEDFLTARRLLEDESYGSIQEAARAVVEKALSMSNDPKSRPGGKHGR